MILALVALLIVILLTAYLVSLGFFSAILEFSAGAFAALFAIGFYEVLAPVLDRWNPDLSRGFAFLLLFFIAFAALRLGFDFLIPRNIVIPTWINSLGAGIVGFFASSIIVGTAVIGIQMLPISEKAAPSIFPAPLASSFFYAASGHSLGGTPLASVHPDLNAELYNYRHTVIPYASHSLSSDLVKAEAWSIPDEARVKSLGLTHDPDKKLLIVRTSISRGAKPRLSSDTTNFGDQVLITPQQVRLVVNVGDGNFRQYNPIGHLRGDKFESFLDSDRHLRNDIYVAEDYNADKVAHDWVFEVSDDASAPAKPRWIEIKAGGRTSLADLAPSRTYVPLTARQIPPRASEREFGSIQLVVQYKGKPVSNAQVYILQPVVTHRNVQSLIKATLDDLESHVAAWENNTEGWGAALAGKPGVPQDSALRNARSRARDWVNSSFDENIDWTLLIPAAFLAHQGPDGTTNVVSAVHYLDETIEPLLRSTYALIEKKQTDGQGTFPPIAARPDKYALVIVTESERSFCITSQSLTLKPKQVYKATIEQPKSDDFSIDVP